MLGLLSGKVDYDRGSTEGFWVGFPANFTFRKLGRMERAGWDGDVEKSAAAVRREVEEGGGGRKFGLNKGQAFIVCWRSEGV